MASAPSPALATRAPAPEASPPPALVRGRAALPLALLATAASAVLWSFGTGLSPIAWLTWLAPLPVLLLATRVPTATAVLSGGLAWLGGQLGLWDYYAGDLGMPVPLVAGLFAGTAAVFALAVWLFRRLALGRRTAAALLAAVCVPAVWVALEYTFSLALPHGAYWSLAYTQADDLPIAQTASVTGVWGVTFLLLLVPSAVAALCAPGTAGRTRLVTAVAALVALALPLGYGLLRLETAGPPAAPVAVAAFYVPAPYPVIPYDRPEAAALTERYRAELPAVAATGARVVVLPEKVFWVGEARRAEFLDTWSGIAKGAGVDVVVGAALGEGGATYNVAAYLPADGGAPVLYRKHHLIPGLETEATEEDPEITPGTDLALVPGTSWGLLVCKDLDFPALSAEYRDAGAGLVLAPALDFDADAWLHGRSAVFRGIEQGFSLVRTAEQGEATISDPYGRVRASTGAAVTARVGTVAVDTVYAGLGDWFAWLSLALLAAAVLAALRGRPVVPGG